MKPFKIYAITCIAIMMSCLASCYKDKGNYDIDMPLEPQVTGLDTLYHAVVGDSLIIEPKITGIPSEHIQCTWRIAVPEELSPEHNRYEGNSLRIPFGLQAKRYRARLTVTNTQNGMKYFHTFYIQGVTEFSVGSLVLSQDGGVTKLSFIKPDGTVQPNIYEAINNEHLPNDPLHIHYLRNMNTGGLPLAYWIITKHGGVRLNVNDLQKEQIKPGTLQENFFLPPANIEVGSLKNHRQGVLMGIINHKFYGGTTSTWDQNDNYGMFGAYAPGNYTLAPQFILTTIGSNVSMIAYEKERRQFVRLEVQLGPVYFGTQYSVDNTDAFDPQDVGLDLIQIVQINSADTYAYMQDAEGQLFELKFTAAFNANPFTFRPMHKRLFARQEWMHADTKLLATQTGYIYIAAENKIYRYNPLNEQILELEATFSNPVTMLKLDDDQNTLIAGSGNSIYNLDIRTGRNGNITGKIDGIPGQPIDMVWRR
ncbi:PKD-like family lipoprotein [Sphingobacterium gobiense]|nr:PKD-like family lipoprotein [Sphingobacterium gobiense]